MILYRMYWKHKDFTDHSEGPILRHSLRGSTKIGEPYTKRWVEKICRKFANNGKKYNAKNIDGKIVKLPVVKHWIREVFV